MRLSGATYEEIANNGGGIVSSVASVRSATPKELFDMAIPRLDRFISMGTTTIEAKSGYGLNTESELKSLKVISNLSEKHAIDIVPTFMGAHAFPVEYENKKEDYVDLVINEMIPEVEKQGIAKFIDVFASRDILTLINREAHFKSG